MAISAAQFQIQGMPSWEWNSTKSSDTRAKNEQVGIFVTLNDELARYFPGISTEFIGHRQWSHLRLFAMSELQAWGDLASGFAIEPKNNEDHWRQIWEPYRRWVYSIHDSSRWISSSTLYPEQRRVYNVMLVQRRGRFYERVAVGQIDKISWNKGNPVEETILLV
jgi:hypothetical protein